MMHSKSNQIIKIFSFALLLFVVGIPSYAQKKTKLVLTADAAYSNLRYYQAASLYQKALNAKINVEYVLERLGDCYWETRNFSKALFWYDSLERLDTHNSIFEQRYIEALKANRKYSEALLQCKKFITTYGASSTVEEEIKFLEDVSVLYEHSDSYRITYPDFNSDYRDFGPVLYKNNFAFTSSRPIKPDFYSRNLPLGDKRDFEYCKIFSISDLESVQVKPFNESIATNSNQSFSDKSIHVLKEGKMNVGPVTFSNDGIIAYYTVNGGFKKHKSILEIKQATVEGEKFVNEKPFIYNNPEYSVEHPALSPDGHFLYFTSDKPGGFGGFDIYSCEKDSAGWKQPKNIGNLANSGGNELFPSVDHEGNLYFSSDSLPGLGAIDIFFVRMKDGVAVGKPVNLGYPINSAWDDFGITVSKDKSYGYFSSNRRNDNDDIYRFDHFNSLFIKGVVIDSISKLFVDSARVTLREVNGISSYNILTQNSGSISSIWENECLLDVTVQRAGYKSYHQRIYTKKLRDHFLMIFLTPDTVVSRSKIEASILPKSDTVTVKQNTVEIPALSAEIPAPATQTPAVSVSQEIGRKSIQFEFNSADIRTADVLILDSIKLFLKKNPETNIVIAGFTDCKGNKKINERLAKKRSEKVKSYLVKKGVSGKRVFVELYSKKHMILPCKEDTTYNRQKQMYNRRVEMIVTDKQNPHWYPSGKEINETSDYISNWNSRVNGNINSRSLAKTSLLSKRNKAMVIKDQNAKAKPISRNNSKEYLLSKDSMLQGMGHLRTPALYKKNETEIVNQMYQRESLKPINLYTSSDSVLIELYDNGIFDYDTISVVFNKKLVVYKQLLRVDKPISFYIKLSDDDRENTMLFYADNLGLISPNSALMIITDGYRKRTEISVTNDLKHNSLIYFIKPKNGDNN